MTTTIPRSVLGTVNWIVQHLRSRADIISNGRQADRMFGGGGRYEWEATQCDMANVSKALERLDLFRTLAAANGVDAEAVLRAAGMPDESEWTLSPAAVAYGNDAS